MGSVVELHNSDTSIIMYMDHDILSGTLAGSAIQSWQNLALLLSVPQHRHCNCTSWLISHQYTPVVFKGALLYEKDTSETLFCIGRERSRFWRWVLFQVYFFYSLRIVDSSVLERGQDRSIQMLRSWGKAFQGFWFSMSWKKTTQFKGSEISE